jgi:hypothetical protein
MQQVANPLLDKEEPSLLSQLVHYAGKMPEPQLQELVIFLKKKQIVKETATLSEALRTETPFPISFEELGVLLQNAEKEKPNA